MPAANLEAPLPSKIIRFQKREGYSDRLNDASAKLFKAIGDIFPMGDICNLVASLAPDGPKNRGQQGLAFFDHAQHLPPLHCSIP